VAGGVTMVADGNRSVPRSRRAALAGSALVVAGLLLMFFGVGRAFVTEVGRPWDVSFGGPTRGPRTGTIVPDDGRTESFQADDGDELRTLLDKREAELAEEYDLRTTALVGKAVLVAGLLAVVVGLAVLARALARGVRARRTPRAAV